MRIIIDPGHGGKDPGAVGPRGTREADVAWDIAEKLRIILAGKKHDVRLTRRREQFLELRERTEFSNQARAELFVSIHLNGGPPSAHGFEVFCHPASAKGAEVRDAVLSGIARAFPDWRNRGVKATRYYVLAHSKAPAILVECAFITNPIEEVRVLDPRIRQRLAEAIAAGIEAATKTQADA